jgi:hypothetical protein
MDIKINLSNSENKDLVSFCNLNDRLVSEVVKKSFTAGFHIEKYGLLNSEQEVKEVEVIKEVIKYVEVPVETIKEVEVIKEVEKIVEVKVPEIQTIYQTIEKEVPVEKVVEKIVEIVKEVPVEKVVIQEVIKEVPVEKVVTKTEYISDNTQINELLSKIQQLENTPPKIVEVIKEIPVDRVVIQEKLVEVVVEKEVIVEKPVEVIVEKEVVREVEKTVVDNSKSQMLQETLQKIRGEGIEKDKRIKELEKQIDDIKQMDIQRGAVYLRGSNLNDTLYK